MTLNEIRQQLKTIRLYYMSKARFSAAFESLPHKAAELADKYAEITADLNYSTEYIQMKNKRLLLFLQQKINGEAS